jgi:hypothetical protein
MPPKKNVTIAAAPADSDAAGSRGETIVEFFEQLENCRATNPLAETIYADAAEDPPSVEIPVEFLDLHDNLDSDDGTIAEATIYQATKTLRQLCADRDRQHQKNLEAFSLGADFGCKPCVTEHSLRHYGRYWYHERSSLRPVESGFEADEIMFAYDMSKPNFSNKDKREMEALINDASSFQRLPELLRKLREHIQARNLVRPKPRATPSMISSR